MANRHNHYEAAFEAYLRSRGTPYIAVDEAKRSLLSNGDSIKSLDFIVAAPGRNIWLIDIKGRRFPAGEAQKQYWKNWSTRDDMLSLARWERLFGENFSGLFVFVYHLVDDRSPLPAEELFKFHDNLYGMMAVRLSDYVANARPVSPRWNTWAMPAATFRHCAQPLSKLLGPETTISASICSNYTSQLKDKVSNSLF